MAPPEHHLDRESALSFGSAADLYDRFRPSPPRALVDDLLACGPGGVPVDVPADVLDVACGPGKAAVELAARGARVLGVEADERMAGIARGHGVPVEAADFESWDAAGRRFDLVTCADAWHWIDPARGSEQAAAVLRPGGTLAVFWSYYLLDDEVAALFQRVYDTHAPQARTHSYVPLQARGEPFAPVPEFGPAETRGHRWDATVSAADRVGLLATFSDHQALAPRQLTDLQTRLHEVVDGLGGSVTVSHGVHAAFVQRR
jgi:SAM-dependent methyltransferase